MVSSNGSFEDIYLFSGTNLPDDIPQPKAYVVLQNLLAVFGTPDDVILIIVGSMGSVAVSGHNPSILKSWAKAQRVPLGVDLKPLLHQEGFVKLLLLSRRLYHNNFNCINF